MVKNELDRMVDLIAITAASINSLLNVDAIVLGGEDGHPGEILYTFHKKSNRRALSLYPLYNVFHINGLLAFGQQHMLEDI